MLKKAVCVFSAFAAVLALTCASAYAEEKVGYGQGVITDDKNRPSGAVEAQERYGHLGGRFITDDEKTIYLTFDEGYENGYTAIILDILKEKKVTATFYVTYDYAERNNELINRMIAEGHSVGNHSMTHPSLPDCTDKEVIGEIMRLQQYIEDNFGYTMRTVRPPKGEFSERTLSLTNCIQMESVFWSFAYADWDTNAQPSADKAFEKIISATHDGEICLLHAVSKTNTEILADVIDKWHELGYTVKAYK